ncbi:MAG: hypothetical protein FJY95_09585 [Candidatus Handelsmanbacteria bacterium]|nr:hypothetical protein [Candidatus Handelsmanbacteria bacterium]
MTEAPPPSGSSYEFTEVQNQTIRSLALYMQILAAIMIAFGGLQAVGGLLDSDDPIAKAGIFQGAVILILGVLTLRAAVAFRRIVSSTGGDIGHLMNALGTLRGLYQIQAILIIALVIAAMIIGVTTGE